MEPQPPSRTANLRKRRGARHGGRNRELSSSEPTVVGERERRSPPPGGGAWGPVAEGGDVLDLGSLTEGGREERARTTGRRQFHGRLCEERDAAVAHRGGVGLRAVGDTEERAGSADGDRGRVPAEECAVLPVNQLCQVGPILCGGTIIGPPPRGVLLVSKISPTTHPSIFRH
jgi:hypothetical protein